MRSIITNLTPASGRQDHTTSPSARSALSSAAPPASIASQPYVRDDRETPLVCGLGCERCRSDLGQKGTGIFLREGLDSESVICPSGQNQTSCGTTSARRQPVGWVERSDTHRVACVQVRSPSTRNINRPCPISSRGRRSATKKKLPPATKLRRYPVMGHIHKGDLMGIASLHPSYGLSP